MSAIRIDIEDILRPYAGELTTRRIVLEQDLLSRTWSFLQDLLPAGRWLLVADETTWKVAGEAVKAGLENAGIGIDRWLIEPGPGETTPVADDAKIDVLSERLRQEDYRAVVAVGAGTINDIAKMATTQTDTPFAVVATAPSMNGYTSGIAAILSSGVKITAPCRPAVAVLADLDIMARAPYRMIASGLGDLISKPVSTADWRLAYRLLGAGYATHIMDLADEGARLLAGIAPRLPHREVEAVGQLSASLCVSGATMALAGTSALSSGGEHLISHYLDMTHFAWGEPHDFHGCQVGVATVTTAALYERLAAFAPEKIDADAILAAHPSWEEHARQIEQRFGFLAEAILPHAREGHPSHEELRERLHRLKEKWESIMEDVQQTLQPARALQQELETADCPKTFPEIDVAPERARRAVIHSKDIRARYTILHLGADLGLLKQWTDEVLSDYHGISREDTNC